jgi:hypothetical protein
MYDIKSLDNTWNRDEEGRKVIADLLQFLIEYWIS